MTKINLRVISKCGAHLQFLTKTPVKFQKDWDKVVRGVALTRYLRGLSKKFVEFLHNFRI